MPRKPKQKRQEIEEEVLTSDSYHSQMQDKDEIESENEMFDYIKNNARQAFEHDVEEAKKSARDNNQPFDFDYSEKGVPILPTPCEITKDSNGREIPHPVSPFDIYNPEKDIAIVYFTMDNKPLYENDKKTLKIAKSTDREYMSLNDESAPDEVKAFAQAIQRIVTRWEQKHPLEASATVEHSSTLTPNQKAFETILDFCKLPKNNFKKKLTENEKNLWKKATSDATVRKLVFESNVHPVLDIKKLFSLVGVIKRGIKQDVFDLPKQEKAMVW